MMQIEHRVSIAASAARIFAIYQDVANWHTWDPDTNRASLDGPFRVGARGTLTPGKGRKVPMMLTAVEPDRSFTVESRIPFFHMRFEHQLLPDGSGTEVVHRITFSGALSALLGPLLAKRLDLGLPRTLANLKQLAEVKDQR